MRVARPVVLSSDQQEILESRARARSAPARSVERARIVLLAGAGLQDQQIAAKLKITPEKAARWRNRFLDGGFAALDKDAPRPGRTPVTTRLMPGTYTVKIDADGLPTWKQDFVVEPGKSMTVSADLNQRGGATVAVR